MRETDNLASHALHVIYTSKVQSCEPIRKPDVSNKQKKHPFPNTSFGEFGNKNFQICRFILVSFFRTLLKIAVFPTNHRICMEKQTIFSGNLIAITELRERPIYVLLHSTCSSISSYRKSSTDNFCTALFLMGKAQITL